MRLEEDNITVEERKIEVNMHLADIVDNYKINMDANRTKIRKIKKHAMHKEMHLHYALGAVVIFSYNCGCHVWFIFVHWVDSIRG